MQEIRRVVGDVGELQVWLLPVPAEPEALGDRAARLVRDQGIWAFHHERELRALLALSLAPDAEERGVSRRGKMRRSQ